VRDDDGGGDNQERDGHTAIVDSAVS